MRFVKIRRFLHRVYEGIKLIICRPDLPRNPKWREEGYPYANCWDIDEFFEEASKAGIGSHLYAEARRIYWEAYWRLLGRYKRCRPFFDIYIKEYGILKPLEDKQKWVLENIITAAMTHGIVPEEVKAYTYRVYRTIYGPLTR